MKIMKTLLALLLTVTILFSCSGCMLTTVLLEEIIHSDFSDYDDDEASPEPTQNHKDNNGGNISPNNKKDDVDYGDNPYNTDISHGDYDFSEMTYEEYDVDEFDQYTDAIYDLAENGGTVEEFEEADNDMLSELYYVYTMYQLAEIASYGDATDVSASNDEETAYEAFDTVYQEYFAAMSAMANSTHVDLMEEVYSEDYIDAFKDFEEETDEERERTEAVNELIDEYYSLMSENNVDYDAVVDLYVELVNLYKEEAKDNGYDSVAEYAYAETYAKNYTPEDAQAIWEGAKNYIVDYLADNSDDIMDSASDVAYSDRVDYSSDNVVKMMQVVIPEISPYLEEPLNFMLDHQLYDTEYDEDKAATGFTTTLYYYNEPYIFNSPYDSIQDFSDMFHEFGHYTNAYYTESDLLFGICDLDLAELQSQGMEVMASFYYDEIYENEEDAEAVQDYLLLNLAYSISDGAMYDEFQQKVYAEDNLTSEKVLDIFKEVYEEYGYEPYDGYEYEWTEISHNFESPFYYISYAVSAIGALEIYELCTEDMSNGTQIYMQISAMDTEAYYFTDAIEEVGLSDIFDIDTYKKIVEVLEN